MSDKNKSVEELKDLLAKMEAEQEVVNEKFVSLPSKIEGLREKYKKATVKQLNAEGELEEAEIYLEIVKSRKDQLVGIVDGLKEEIESR